MHCLQAYALLLTQPPQDQGYSITPERFLCQKQAGSRLLIVELFPFIRCYNRFL